MPCRSAAASICGSYPDRRAATVDGGVIISTVPLRGRRRAIPYPWTVHGTTASSSTNAGRPSSTTNAPAGTLGQLDPWSCRRWVPRKIRSPCSRRSISFASGIATSSSVAHAWRVVGRPAAQSARAVSGGERHSLVVEEQHGEMAGYPLRQLPVLVLQGTDDPQGAAVEADDVGAQVKDAPVSRPCATQLDGHEIAHRGDTVTLRLSHRGEPSLRHRMEATTTAATSSTSTTGTRIRRVRASIQLSYAVRALRCNLSVTP